jgi:hypothetical protein
VTLLEAGARKRTLPTLQDDAAIPGTFVLARIDGSLDDASATAATPDGVDLAAQTLR